ncbi:hypothetical protein SAMN06296952_0823 [Oscillospiraceae bacterium]|nr:hypothetical protein SAMN06296952_0823 [Oscillospiraceae bacterium]
MEKFPCIDYKDMISDLEEDTAAGYITGDSSLYILRQKTSVFVECIDREVRPVLDYFYDKPELQEKLSSMTVKEAKKLCFDISSTLEDDRLKEAVTILIDDMNSYSKGNPKRNGRPCKLIMTKKDLPMMVYYGDFDPSDELEIIKAEELLAELRSCFSTFETK